MRYFLHPDDRDLLDVVDDLDQYEAADIRESLDPDRDFMGDDWDTIRTYAEQDPELVKKTLSEYYERTYDDGFGDWLYEQRKDKLANKEKINGL